MPETLDLVPEVTKENATSDDPVVRTALQMIREFDNTRSDKDARVRNVKNLWLNTVNGLLPTRKERIPSFLINQLVEIYNSFIRVPDIQVKSLGIKPEESVLLSAYLEKIVRDGGFNELMTEGWSGYHQQAAYGDLFVQCGIKTTGKIGMPEFRGVSSGDFYTNSSATKIRSKTSGQSAYRFGITHNFDVNVIEDDPFFKGVTEIAKPGDLPSLDAWTNETKETTDLQDSDQEKKKYYQVLFFYDITKQVFAAIVGSNAVKWGETKDENYEFKFEDGGKLQPFLPITQFGLFANPEGIFHTGIGELFMKVAISLGILDNGVMGTAIDNEAAPAILNIPEVDIDDLFGQIKTGMDAHREKGDNTYVVPAPMVDDAGNQLAPVGVGSIGYLKKDTNIEVRDAIKRDVETEVGRFGFNLNTFSNQQDTARQSELDIIGQNQTISKFQGQNTESYRFVYDFGVWSIKKFGDENDDTVFGEGVTFKDKGGEEFEASDLGITVGQLVKRFKELDNIEIEVDTKNGFVSNPLLEKRTLLGLLQVVADGSPAQKEYQEALARLEGHTLPKESFEGQPGQPIAPQAPSLAQPIQQQLNEV